MELDKEYFVIVPTTDTSDILPCISLDIVKARKIKTESGFIVYIDKEDYEVIEENKDFSGYNNPYVENDLFLANQQLTKHFFRK